MFRLRLLPWEYGVRNLLRRPARSALTLGALSTVVLLVFVVVAFIRGLETSLAVTGQPNVVLVYSINAAEDIENSAIPARSASLLSASLEGVEKQFGVARISPELYVGTRISLRENVITLLSEVHLNVEQGEFVSLMGASGSGKSTLLNAIAGIDRPTSGQIVIKGTDITKLSRATLADWRAANIGYIFQMHNLLAVLSAYENIELPLLLLPMSATERHKRVMIALEAVHLVDRKDRYPRQLSGGQEQRVGIARAIVANPTIIVADEPSGDLDAETTDQILDLIQRLNTELGMTMIVVTHDPRVGGLASKTTKKHRKNRGFQPFQTSGGQGTLVPCFS